MFSFLIAFNPLSAEVNEFFFLMGYLINLFLDANYYVAATVQMRIWNTASERMYTVHWDGSFLIRH